MKKTNRKAIKEICEKGNWIVPEQLAKLIWNAACDACADEPFKSTNANVVKQSILNNKFEV